MKDSQARKEGRVGGKRKREGERRKKERREKRKSVHTKGWKEKVYFKSIPGTYFFQLGPILSTMPTTSGQPIRLGCKPLEHGLEWCGLNGNGPHRLTNFNTWSSGSGTIWKNWETWPCQRKWVTGWALRFYKKPIPSPTSPSSCCLQILTKNSVTSPKFLGFYCCYFGDGIFSPTRTFQKKKTFKHYVSGVLHHISKSILHCHLQ